jgi:hypothetical protein
LRFDTLTAGKTFRTAKKPGRFAELFLFKSLNLVTVMMAFVVAMVVRFSARRNDRDSQDDECYSSKKQRTQLHVNHSPAATLFE